MEDEKKANPNPNDDVLEQKTHLVFPSPLKMLNHHLLRKKNPKPKTLAINYYHNHKERTRPLS